MMIGTRWAYTSVDGGHNLYRREPQFPLPISAMAYGGRSSGTDEPGIAFVAEGSNLWLRRTDGGSTFRQFLRRSLGYGPSRISCSIPKNGGEFSSSPQIKPPLVTLTDVPMSDAVTATWTPFGAPRGVGLHSIEYVHADASTEVLLVGGLGGVYRLAHYRDPDTDQYRLERIRPESAEYDRWGICDITHGTTSLSRERKDAEPGRCRTPRRF